MRKSLLMLALAAFMLVPGCKPKKAEIAGWQQFQDDYFRVTFTHPKDWVLLRDPNKVAIYSSAEAAEKFFDHEARKQDGVQIVVAAEPGKTAQDAVAYLTNHQNEQKAAGFTVKEMGQTTIEGVNAPQVQYSGIFESPTGEKVKVTTIRAAVLKDSILYFFQYSALNDWFESYRVVFDSVVSSIALPRPVIIPKGVSPAIPLAEIRKYGSDVLTLDHPANFAVSPLPAKGEVTFGIQVAGNLPESRQDCSVTLDVRPAKKLTAEKLADQNSKIFKPTSKGETKISDQKALFFNYTPQGVKNVKSRVYFMVKDDKFYRVIINYFAPMEKDFLPAFEKVVASIRIK